MPAPDAPQLENLPSGQPLARYTAARLGGAADYLFIAKDPTFRDVTAILQQAWQRAMPVTLIGGGANVLVADSGIRGLTIINRASQLAEVQWAGKHGIRAASGTNLIRLARYCQERGYSGMEWAVAVPGTVGGAVVNNAGAHGGDIAQALHCAAVYEAAGLRRCRAAELDYGYRHSLLKTRRDRRFMVLSALFELERDDPAAIKARMERHNAHRRRTQPPGASLGSIFKNPPGDYAGRLIEAAQLKGCRIGGVQVSPVHANFLVNTSPSATAADYLRLIRLIQARVKYAFGVQLELEIQILGDWQPV